MSFSMSSFSYFDPKPLAAASLAQVHRAVLKDGREVAVKVQYPGLREESTGDVITIGILIRAAKWVHACAHRTAAAMSVAYCERCLWRVQMFPEFQFMWLEREFHDNLPKELGACYCMWREWWRLPWWCWCGSRC